MGSVLTKNQKKVFGPKFYKDHGRDCKIVATVRHDDSCGNGHNSFAVTCDIYEKNGRGQWVDVGGGADHELIAKHFAELQPVLRFHLFDTRGPMHYVANTVYLAGDKDHWGGREGEVRTWAYGVQLPNGEPLHLYTWLHKDGQVYKERQELAQKMVDQIPGAKLLKTPDSYHEGKKRELDAARRAACWPEATDEELCADDLKERLLARLPKIMEEFKAAVESLGLVF